MKFKLFIFTLFLIFQNLILSFPKQGEIYWVNFDCHQKGTTIKKSRPAIIVSSDKLNKHSSRVMVAPLTTKKVDKILPFEVPVIVNFKAGKILCDQITTIDIKEQLGKKIEFTNSIDIIEKVFKSIKIALGLKSKFIIEKKSKPMSK